MEKTPQQLPPAAPGERQRDHTIGNKSKHQKNASSHVKPADETPEEGKGLRGELGAQPAGRLPAGTAAFRAEAKVAPGAHPESPGGHNAAQGRPRQPDPRDQTAKRGPITVHAGPQGLASPLSSSVMATASGQEAGRSCDPLLQKTARSCPAVAEPTLRLKSGRSRARSPQTLHPQRR